MLTVLLSPSKVFYILGGVILFTVAVIILSVSRWSITSEAHRRLKGMVLTALWTCFGLMILVLFSTWQGLPSVGSPVAFWLVVGALALWSVGIVLYRLTAFRRQLRLEQQSLAYARYLPKQKN